MKSAYLGALLSVLLSGCAASKNTDPGPPGDSSMPCKRDDFFDDSCIGRERYAYYCYGEKDGQDFIASHSWSCMPVMTYVRGTSLKRIVCCDDPRLGVP